MIAFFSLFPAPQSNMATETCDTRDTCDACDTRNACYLKYEQMAQQTPCIEASDETRANTALLACAQVGTLKEFQYLFKREFPLVQGASREDEFVLRGNQEPLTDEEFEFENAVRVALFFGNHPVTEYLFQLTRGRIVERMCKYCFGVFTVPPTETKFFLNLLRRYPYANSHELLGPDNILSLTLEEAREYEEVLRGVFVGLLGNYFESINKVHYCSTEDKIKLLEYFPEEVLLNGLLKATTDWMEVEWLLEHRPSFFKRNLIVSGREPVYGWTWESISSTPEDLRGILSDLRGPLRFFKK